MNKFNLIIIIFIVISVVSIFGYTIISVINKKLNNISINIPEPKVIIDKCNKIEPFDNKKSK